MDLRLRASPSHSGEGVWILILVADPPRGRPIGGGGIYRIRGGIRISAPIIVILFYLYYSHKTDKSKNGSTTILL
jgi:hypothetical protein